MYNSRSDKLVGFLHGASRGYGRHGRDFLTCLACLAKCLESDVPIYEDNSPPAMFMFEDVPDDCLDYEARVNNSEVSIDSLIVRSLPLAATGNKKQMTRLIDHMARSEEESCASKAVALLVHYAITTDNSLWSIYVVSGASITEAAPRRGSDMYHRYMLAWNADLEYIVFDESPLSLMSTAYWAIRELNRCLVRWEIDTQRANEPDFRVMYMSVMNMLGKKTNRVIYHLVSSAVLAAIIGAANIGADTPPPRVIYDFITVYYAKCT